MVKIMRILPILLALVVISCERTEEYPIEPKITFIEFEKFYNPELKAYDQGVLKFEFTDGDGDLGLAEGDTFPPFNPGSKYYYNLIIDFFEVRNGVETRVPIVFFNSVTQVYDTVFLSARMPLLLPKGVTRPLSGEIYDTLFIYNFNSPYDTLFLEFYIVDRALHESNVERTGYITRR